MKSIELKAVKETVYIGIAEQEIVLTTYGLLKSVINKSMENGYAIDEMMQRLKLYGLLTKYKHLDIPIDKKIEDISDEFISKTETMEIEDADYMALHGWVKNMRWNILSNFIVDFVNGFDKQ